MQTLGLPSMAIKKAQFIYSIDLPGFERTLFAQHTRYIASLDSAVRYAKIQGGVLPTIAEAAAFRSQADGQHNADGPQLTRTSIIFSWAHGDESRLLLSFDNELVTRYSHELENTNNKWRIPSQTACVQATLKQAYQYRKQVLAPASNLRLDLEKIVKSPNVRIE